MMDTLGAAREIHPHEMREKDLSHATNAGLVPKSPPPPPSNVIQRSDLSMPSSLPKKSLLIPHPLIPCLSSVRYKYLVR